MKLEDIYPKYSLPDKGGDKGTQHSYIEIYSKYISPDTKSLLEVGVWEGHSLAMWQDYLPQARVLGIDIAVYRVKFEVEVLHVDATVRGQLDQALGDETFDVIIDDGSHRVHDQIASFEHLFERVNPGGVYFIEDVAGPDALRVLSKHLDSKRIDYTQYDLRALKDRFDDILIMAYR